MNECDGSEGVGGTVADVAGVSLGEMDVALISPGLSPAVLDGPSFLRGSDQEDGMVGVDVAVVKSSVLVEVPVGSINSDSQGSSGKHLFHGFASCEVSNTLDVIFASWCLAFLVDCLVGVFTFGGLSKVSDVLKSPKCQTSVAASVAVGSLSCTVNQLLL
jgi:hypothetical protein